MPLIDSRKTVRIELPRDDEWVEVKAELSRGDRVRIRQAVLAGSKTRANPDVTSGLTVEPDLVAGADASEFAEMDVAIVGWSFNARVTPENIRRLDDDSVDCIQKRLKEIYPQPRTDQEKNGSGPNTSGPETTSSLSPLSSAG